MKRLKEILLWFAKEFLKTILIDPLGKLILGFLLSFFLPFLLSITQSGQTLLSEKYSVSGWVILTISGMFVSLVYVVTRVIYAAYKQRSRADIPYEWRGFFWLLTTDFWSNCLHLPASTAGDGFLATAILGPLCPRCKRDLAPLIREQRSVCACSMKFDVEVPEAHDVKRFGVDALRRAAYREAQAAVRRKELRQSTVYVK